MAGIYFGTLEIPLWMFAEGLWENDAVAEKNDEFSYAKEDAV